VNPALEKGLDGWVQNHYLSFVASHLAGHEQPCDLEGSIHMLSVAVVLGDLKN
jgi:hypothetical protein